MKNKTLPTGKKRDPLAGHAADLQLYRAVRRYVESGNGTLAVIGGIEIQQWPGDPPSTYRVAVSVTGRKPVFPKMGERRTSLGAS